MNVELTEYYGFQSLYSDFIASNLYTSTTRLKEVGFDDSVLNDLRKREDDDVATANDIVHWINTYIFSFI